MSESQNKQTKISGPPITFSNYFRARVLMNNPNSNDTCTNSYSVNISSQQKLCHFTGNNHVLVAALITRL